MGTVYMYDTLKKKNMRQIPVHVQTSTWMSFAKSFKEGHTYTITQPPVQYL